jgi:hypothetical protein
MLDDCAARSKWNFDYLAAQLGEREVEVQFGRDADPNYEMNSVQHKRRMPFGEYVAMVRDAGVTNDFYMTANNDGQNREALRELMSDLPPLDDYLQPGSSGFFWFGPAGTITPFHHDLTNNFMIQVAGRKRAPDRAVRHAQAVQPAPLLHAGRWPQYRPAALSADGRRAGDRLRAGAGRDPVPAGGLVALCRSTGRHHHHLHHPLQVGQRLLHLVSGQSGFLGHATALFT